MAPLSWPARVLIPAFTGEIVIPRGAVVHIGVPPHHHGVPLTRFTVPGQVTKRPHQPFVAALFERRQIGRVGETGGARVAWQGTALLGQGVAKFLDRREFTLVLVSPALIERERRVAGGMNANRAPRADASR